MQRRRRRRSPIAPPPLRLTQRKCYKVGTVQPVVQFRHQLRISVLSLEVANHARSRPGGGWGECCTLNSTYIAALLLTHDCHA